MSLKITLFLQISFFIQFQVIRSKNLHLNYDDMAEEYFSSILPFLFVSFYSSGLEFTKLLKENL